MRKYLWMLSAAVMIGTLRLRCIYHLLQYLLTLTLLHSESPKLYAILAFLSAIGLKGKKKMSDI